MYTSSEQVFRRTAVPSISSDQILQACTSTLYNAITTVPQLISFSCSAEMTDGCNWQLLLMTSSALWPAAHTFDLHKVGGYEQRHQRTAALAVHGHTEGHALAHDDCGMHHNDCQGHHSVGYEMPQLPPPAAQSDIDQASLVFLVGGRIIRYICQCFLGRASYSLHP